MHDELLLKILDIIKPIDLYNKNLTSDEVDTLILFKKALREKVNKPE
tara:strand:+ start:709 stop:849 length:141 start_codon:yes stop_codon:yes gene_type:complete